MTNPTGAGRPKLDETKDWSFLIAFESKYKPVINTAATQADRSMSDYVRNLIKADLRARGLVDDLFEPITEVV